MSRPEWPLEHGMLVEPKASVLAPVESKTKEAKENRRTAQAKEQACWNRETKAVVLWTWRRLKLLSDHGTLILKVG